MTASRFCSRVRDGLICLNLQVPICLISVSKHWLFRQINCPDYIYIGWLRLVVCSFRNFRRKRNSWSSRAKLATDPCTNLLYIFNLSQRQLISDHSYSANLVSTSWLNIEWCMDCFGLSSQQSLAKFDLSCSASDDDSVTLLETICFHFFFLLILKWYATGFSLTPFISVNKRRNCFVLFGSGGWKIKVKKKNPN